jgi:hypothetical protein
LHEGHCRARPRPERLSRSFERSHTGMAGERSSIASFLLSGKLKQSGSGPLEVDQRRAENCRTATIPGGSLCRFSIHRSPSPCLKFRR